MRLPWLRGHNRRRHQSVALLVRLRLAGQQAGRVLQIVVPIVMVAGLLGGVVWSVYRFVTTTPYFQLRRLELSGLQQLREEEVREWAGLSERTHLLALDPLEVARRLKQQPWVADARAERYLPDRLVVHIVERKPAALLLLEGLHLVDQHGHVFLRSNGLGAQRLPVITGLQAADLATDRVRSELRIRQALAVLREWERQKLTQVANPSEVHLDPVLGLVLYTEESGTRVQLGWADHPLRLARLREVLLALRAEGHVPSYVLLDNEVTPQRVTVGLAGSGPDRG